ncbi:DUF2255 family protein [Cellulosimicrobium cellulans]|uniref:DUF2255 family protein n=1 Tax=Cellulosimicrobium cellulans TaxID=1710 RepID=UPI0030173032
MTEQDAATWQRQQLDAFAAAEEITIQTMRADGGLRRAIPIWVVAVGDELFVRSSHGRGSGWYRGATTRHRAVITGGGQTQEVDLVEEPGRGVEIDAAYRRKYGRYERSFLPALLAEPARGAAFRVEPAREHTTRAR